jgi:hypothetical protein
MHRDVVNQGDSESSSLSKRARDSARDDTILQVQVVDIGTRVQVVNNLPALADIHAFEYLRFRVESLVFGLLLAPCKDGTFESVPVQRGDDDGKLAFAAVSEDIHHEGQMSLGEFAIFLLYHGVANCYSHCGRSMKFMEQCWIQKCN